MALNVMDLGAADDEADNSTTFPLKTRSGPFAGTKMPACQLLPRAPLHRGERSALESVDQILGVQFQLLQANFLELFVFGEITFLKQFFQPLGVALMFGMQTIQLFAQRGILYFIHPAPP